MIQGILRGVGLSRNSPMLGVHFVLHCARAISSDPVLEAFAAIRHAFAHTNIKQSRFTMLYIYIYVYES